MLGFEPKLSDSQSKNLGNILQEATENFGLHSSNVQCKRHMYILLKYYTITIVFLSSYNKAKTVFGMLCRDESIIALIIGQYMKYRPRKRPRGTSVFYSFYISYIDLFNRAIIDTYIHTTTRLSIS